MPDPARLPGRPGAVVVPSVSESTLRADQAVNTRGGVGRAPSAAGRARQSPPRTTARSQTQASAAKK